MPEPQEVTEVILFPPWKAAIAKFFEAGFKPGDVVPHSWLYDSFQLTMPKPDMRTDTSDQLRMMFLNYFIPFRQALLKEHQIDLSSERGQGYLYLPPQDQTEAAYHDGIKEMAKALGKTKNRLVNVNVAALTAEQRKQNVDRQVRMGAMATMFKKQRRLNYNPPEEETA